MKSKTECYRVNVEKLVKWQKANSLLFGVVKVESIFYSFVQRLKSLSPHAIPLLLGEGANSLPQNWGRLQGAQRDGVRFKPELSDFQ